MLHVNSFQSKLERRGSQSVAHEKIGETLGSLKKLGYPKQKSLSNRKDPCTGQDYKLSPRISLALSGTKFFAASKQSIGMKHRKVVSDYSGPMPLHSDIKLSNVKATLAIDNSPCSPSKVSTQETVSVVRSSLPKMSIISEKTLQEAEDSCSERPPSKKYKRARSITKIKIRKYPSFRKPPHRLEEVTNRSIILQSDKLMKQTITERDKNYDSEIEFHNRTISSKDLEPIRHEKSNISSKEYSMSIIKAFKCLQDAPAGHDYLYNKRKLKYNLLSLLRKEKYIKTPKDLKEFSLLSIPRIEAQIQDSSMKR